MDSGATSASEVVPFGYGVCLPAKRSFDILPNGQVTSSAGHDLSDRAPNHRPSDWHRGRVALGLVHPTSLVRVHGQPEDPNKHLAIPDHGNRRFDDREVLFDWVAFGPRRQNDLVIDTLFLHVVHLRDIVARGNHSSCEARCTRLRGGAPPTFQCGV